MIVPTSLDFFWPAVARYAHSVGEALQAHIGLSVMDGFRAAAHQGTQMSKVTSSVSSFRLTTTLSSQSWGMKRMMGWIS